MGETKSSRSAVLARKKANKGSPLLRWVGTLVVLALGYALLHGPIVEKRQLHRIRQLLLAVQQGLQRYHVAEEAYPRRSVSGRELIADLVKAKHMEQPPLNPWTGRVYEAPTQSDAESGAAADWLSYRTDRYAETYELVVVRPHTEEVIYRLDSVENQSLDE